VKLVRPISEDEMIAAFLRGELDSDRYGEKLHAFVGRFPEYLPPQLEILLGVSTEMTGWSCF
jgi:hypothetical protein